MPNFMDDDDDYSSSSNEIDDGAYPLSSKTIDYSPYLVKQGEEIWSWASRIRYIGDSEHKELKNILGLTYWSFNNWYRGYLNSPRPKICQLSEYTDNENDADIILMTYEIYKENDYEENKKKIDSILLSEFIEEYNKKLMIELV